MDTYRYPRTLQDAFGPRTSTHIDEPGPARMSRSDKAFTWFCSAVLVGVVTANAVGWI